MGKQECKVCGDTEPVHVHNQGERIEDYFVVGRGESDMDAARRWKDRAIEAEALLREAAEALEPFHAQVEHHHKVGTLTPGFQRAWVDYEAIVKAHTTYKKLKERLGDG